MNRIIKIILKTTIYKIVRIPVVITLLILKPFRCFLLFLEDAIHYAVWKNRLGSLGENTKIYPYVVIHSPENVNIGTNVSIAEFVHIWGGGGIEIGDNVLIASHTVITSLTHDTNALIYRETLIRKKVKIGNNVWIGGGASILPGITIGDGAIIGAGSVVTKDVPKSTIVVGVPARILRKKSEEVT